MDASMIQLASQLGQLAGNEPIRLRPAVRDEKFEKIKNLWDKARVNIIPYEGFFISFGEEETKKTRAVSSMGQKENGEELSDFIIVVMEFKKQLQLMLQGFLETVGRGPHAVNGSGADLYDKAWREVLQQSFTSLFEKWITPWFIRKEISVTRERTIAGALHALIKSDLKIQLKEASALVQRFISSLNNEVDVGLGGAFSLMVDDALRKDMVKKFQGIVSSVIASQAFPYVTISTSDLLNKIKIEPEILNLWNEAKQSVYDNQHHPHGLQIKFNALREGGSLDNMYAVMRDIRMYTLTLLDKLYNMRNKSNGRLSDASGAWESVIRQALYEWYTNAWDPWNEFLKTTLSRSLRMKDIDEMADYFSKVFHESRDMIDTLVAQYSLPDNVYIPYLTLIWIAYDDFDALLKQKRAELGIR